MKHVMEIMDPIAGDIKVEFDPKDSAEVKEAMEKFDEIVGGKKHLAVQRFADGTKKAARTFDPTAVSTTIMPQVVGG